MSSYPEYDWIKDSIKATRREVCGCYTDIRKMKEQYTEKYPEYIIFPEHMRRISEEEAYFELTPVYFLKKHLIADVWDFDILLIREDMN